MLLCIISTTFDPYVNKLLVVGGALLWITHNTKGVSTSGQVAVDAYLSFLHAIFRVKEEAFMKKRSAVVF